MGLNQIFTTKPKPSQAQKISRELLIAMGKSMCASVARGSAMMCFLIGGVLMFMSKQKSYMHGFEFVSRSSDWFGLMLCAFVNVSLSAYNFLVLLIPSNSSIWKIIIFVDVVICGVVCATLGVAWQTYALMYLGNSNVVYADWRPICGLLPNFCRLLLLSIGLSSVGFLVSFMLLVYCVLVSTGAI